MKFTLVENAIDSINHGLEHYLANSASDQKYAILHFVQAVELFFKERLRREHEVFLFTNIDQPKSHRTVSLELALGRVVSLCGVSMSKKEINVIHSLVQLRNQIQHYEFDISEQTARAIMAKTLVEILSFCRDHLDLDIRKNIGSDQWQALTSITEFMDSHARKVLHAFKQSGKTYGLCSTCGYAGLEWTSETQTTCHICGLISTFAICTQCSDVVDRSSLRIFESLEPEENICFQLCPKCAEDLVSRFEEP